MTTNDELSEQEREAFAALPRERVPPAHLEERVVGALRHRGLLGHTRPGIRRPRIAAAVAAGVALFAAGTATGQWMAAGRGPGAAPGDGAGTAARVQETGSAYVHALAQMEAQEAGAPPEAGLEAARAALHAAALELARIRPDDPTIQLVLAVLEERAGMGGIRPEGGQRTTFWF